MFGNKKYSNITIYLGYTIPPYNYFSYDIIQNIITFSDIYKFMATEHYKNNIKLMENEYYCAMIEMFGEEVAVNINIEEEKYEEEDDEKTLKTWEIVLIILGSIAFIIIIICLILKCSSEHASF